MRGLIDIRRAVSLLGVSVQSVLVPPFRQRVWAGAVLNVVCVLLSDVHGSACRLCSGVRIEKCTIDECKDKWRE